MATTRVQLTLNLPPPPALDEHRQGLPMTRTFSSSSASSVGSVPLTPTNQTVSTPTRLMCLGRLNSSSSSLATSDDEDYLSAGNNHNRTPSARDSFSDWLAGDDDFLLAVYDVYLSNPTVAPFAGSVPPSGIVTRVAKETAKKAKIEGRPYNHSLNAIRKRLLLLCRRQDESRSMSISSSQCSGSPKGRQLFSFDDNDETPQTPVFNRPHPYIDDLASYRPEDLQNASIDSPLEKMNIDNMAVKNWLKGTQTPEQPNQQQQHLSSAFYGSTDMLPPTPCSPSLRRSQRKRSAPLPLKGPFTSYSDRPLASPFRETAPSVPTPPPSFNFRAASSSQLSFASGVFGHNSRDSSPSRSREIDPLDCSEDPFPNFTSQRKRNSLNNKRGVRN